MRAIAQGAVAVLVLQGAPARAQEIPPYGDQYCTALGAMYGQIPTVADGCRKNERDYHEKLERVWPIITETERKQCIATAALSAGGSYQGLAGCVILLITSKILNGELKATKP